MNPLKIIAQALQRPQSVAWGTLSAIDPLYELQTKQRLELATGDDNLSRSEAFMQGLRGNISPADTSGSDIAGKIQGTALNIAADPLILAGALGKGALAGTKLAGIAQGAGTVGKLPEGASIGQKLSQGGRQLYQGAMASPDDLGAALGVGLGIRTGERALMKAVSKLGGRAANEIAGQGTEEALSKPTIAQIYEEADKAASFMDSEARRLALDAARTKGMAEAARDASDAAGLERQQSAAFGRLFEENAPIYGDTFEMPRITVPTASTPTPTSSPVGAVERWQPGNAPPLNQDSLVAAARRYLQETGSHGTQADLIQNVPGVRSSNVSNVLGALEADMSVSPPLGATRFRDLLNPIDRSVVPHSAQGLDTNMEVLGLDPRSIARALQGDTQLALPPARPEVDFPVGMRADAPTSQMFPGRSTQAPASPYVRSRDEEALELLRLALSRSLQAPTRAKELGRGRSPLEEALFASLREG